MFYCFHVIVLWWTIADEIIIFSLFFHIWLIDLCEYTLYFANFLRIIHPLYKDLKNLLPAKGLSPSIQIYIDARKHTYLVSYEI